MEKTYLADMHTCQYRVDNILWTRNHAQPGDMNFVHWFGMRRISCVFPLDNLLKEAYMISISCTRGNWCRLLGSLALREVWRYGARSLLVYPWSMHWFPGLCMEYTSKEHLARRRFFSAGMVKGPVPRFRSCDGELVSNLQKTPWRNWGSWSLLHHISLIVVAPALATPS